MKFVKEYSVIGSSPRAPIERLLAQRHVSKNVVMFSSLRASFSGTEAFHKVAEASDGERLYFGWQPMPFNGIRELVSWNA